MVSPGQSSDNTLQARRPTPRLLAFYLPQFHPVPENDVFWGNGFTEWGNVARAKPLFPGHYQPRMPADLGFYDLRLPEARQAQADLAREYGIHGFCYYHYWFEGSRVLERPFEEVLKTGHPDFPFCLCWANHNWTWRRDNKQQGRLMPQQYSEEDDLEHIRWLLEVFEDKRYIKVNGRPLLMVYMPQDLPDPVWTLSMWREEAAKAGVPEPYICKVDSVGNWMAPEEFGCEATVEFWPHGMDRIVEPRIHEESGRVNQITEYEDFAEAHLKRETPSFRRYPCVVPHWDNTARFKPSGARVIHGSTPELYENWLRGVIEKTSQNPPDEQLVFINAWNEWGEGAYLEPDFKYGRAYLEATRRAMLESGAKVPTTTISGDGVEDTPAPATAEELYSELLKKYTHLQKRLVEQLNAEEHTPLVKKMERIVENLTRENEQLKRANSGFRSDRDRLVRWMQELDDGISVLLNSRRWKLSGSVTETGRRILRKPRVSTVEDHLLNVTGVFHTWNSEREARMEAGRNPELEAANNGADPEADSSGGQKSLDGRRET